ncbi:hypothetical protein [Spirosoma flavus]
MRLPQHRISFLLTMAALLTGACSREPAPTPLDPQDLLLVKKVTASYQGSGTTKIRSDTATAQSILYQNVVFYPLTRSQDIYRYDTQRRLTYIETRNPDRPDYTYEWGDVSYEYTNNQLIYTNRRVFPLFPTPFDLNAQGYAINYNTYDQNGYLVFRQDGPNSTVKQTVVNGNIVQRIAQNPTSRTTTTYEYDLTKLGLPNPEKVLWGRPSRNLLMKTTELYESFNGVASIWPDRRVTMYRYEFDGLGRPSQQTAFVELNLRPNPAVVWRELQVSTLDYQ